MSAKKGSETKIREDENTDSGFLSGPIARYPDEEETSESDVKEEKVDDKVKSDNVVDLDSGLDLCLSSRLDQLEVDAVPKVPKLEVTDESSKLSKPEIPYESADIPPLAILFQQDDDGDTQLHIAAVHGCQRSVGTLIRVCPERYLLDLPNDFGHTALHLAVMSGHAVVVRMLVRAGASIDLRDLNGNTPLHLAMASRHKECLQALLAPLENQSATQRRRIVAPVLDQKNYEGQACIHLAANSGDVSILQTLIYFGADVNLFENRAGWTALHIAARRGDLALAQHLLNARGVNVRARDYAGRSPRRLARRCGVLTAKDASDVLAALPEDSEESDDSDDEERPRKRSRMEAAADAEAGADAGSEHGHT